MEAPLRAALLVVASLGASLGAGCFVSEGDCVQRGVSVTPCTVQLRPGQTAVLTARVPGAPGEPVDWIVPEAALGAFTLQADGNRLTMISKSNVPANFPVQASSQAEPSFYGGAVVGQSSATFSSQPPPFFFFGGGLPVGTKAGATAVGGNLYFVAYADALAPLRQESDNRFLKRYNLANNQLSADIPDQFLLFDGPNAPIRPNVAADCAGNAYWIDLLNLPNEYVLRRLRAGSNVVETRPFLNGSVPQFLEIETRSIAVGCQGQIFFVGDDAARRSLWFVTAFGSDPEPVEVPELDDFAFSYLSLAVDEEGRLVAGADFVDGAPLVRLILELVPARLGDSTALRWEGRVDSTFVVDDTLGGVGTLALDRRGAIYAARDEFGKAGDGFGTLSAHNALGETIYVLRDYIYVCPSGCSVPDCGEKVPFNDIQWIGVGEEGRLRAIVRPVADGGLPAPCQESVRLLLLDPQ